MAGMGTRDIKRKIKSVNNTRQITKAMELVSTAKLKRAKDRMNLTKSYFETVLDAVQSIIESEKSLKHDFVTKREVRKTLYIVITGDRGLCGGYNVNAIKEAIKDIDDPSKAVIVTIGRKAGSFFRNNGFEVYEAFEGISEKPEFLHAQAIGRLALNLYKQEKVDEIKFVYSKFISTISQEPEMLKLLPVESRGVQKEEVEADEYEFITYEPSPEEVLSFIIPKYVSSTVYGGLIESAAAEQAARRVAMENASNNADDLIGDLTLSYNQARQAAITQEITEIVGGAEALK
ncbi:ATP synthase F1 subunit gamma [Acidaminobacter sp. JC074]|uniref:ATP synthase F1 subunit gamma n=1 Tax=Acidaminobacter sp. JC074 TaxID=2530199 RepID=UPI001F1106C7|nr:ATP synthase F1 subunit gamma [Acidaminobacter sp. JC074]MCH4889334.1 ATP synthase F1 subunit gamma [Acidaminobacter sp. JC074]